MTTIRVFEGSKAWVAYNLIRIAFLWAFTIPCQLLYLLSNKKDLILSDVGNYQNLILNLILDRHYRNLFYHRIGPISMIFSWILPGADIIIPYSTKLGRNALFVHNKGSHLNAISIGKDFTCYQNVVIGAKSLNSQGRPSIGNNVTIATGAVVVGNITIGDNVKIAANAFVDKSVPDNSLVIGNPANIISRDSRK